MPVSREDDGGGREVERRQTEEREALGARPVEELE